jgi:hypothetical protein
MSLSYYAGSILPLNAALHDLAQWSSDRGNQETIAMAEPDTSKEELMKRIAELEEQLHFRKPQGLEFRVSDKGGVSVYGLGRFPVTLYCEQWLRLLEQADGLRAFLEQNKSKLKFKARAGE